MKLSAMLQKIEGSEEKTASVSPTGGGEKTASATGDALKAALREATEAPTTQEKQAAAAPQAPVADLIKTASQMASAEHEALTKEASLYGAAVADGFMARLSQYNEAAEKIASQQGGQKVASAVPAQSDSFEKFAAENPDLVKQAAEVGYANASAQIEKLAEAARKKGYDEAVATIYKIGHACFSGGFEDTLRLLQEARK